LNPIIKFNAVRLGTLAMGPAGTAAMARHMLHDKARAETLQNASVMKQAARAMFNAFMASIAAVFTAVFVVLNLMLTQFVIRPVTRLAAVAEQVSLGAAEDAPFDVRGNDEIAALARAFSRMPTSLKRAMTMIED
jgi:nitrate/nitrite-specific signal transduction histidine kinase